ncbi:MAG: hypothetical protein ABL985_06680 [Casimicrobium sp.]
MNLQALPVEQTGLWGEPVVVARNKFRPRTDLPCEPRERWTDKAREELLAALVHGELLDALDQSFAKCVADRQADPTTYWLKLMRPQGTDEIEYRDGLRNDLAWVFERNPLFLLCMAAQHANVDAFIDGISRGFRAEIEFFDRVARGEDGLFESASHERTTH